MAQGEGEGPVPNPNSVAGRREAKKPQGSRAADLVVNLSDLKSDPANRRRRTQRGAGMLRDALHQVGAARSIVIDETDEIIAGNGIVEAATEVGIERVRIIDATGDELIAVRRSNLTPEQKRKLALFDNRTGELAEWDPEQIAQDVTDGLEMQPFFTDAELRGIVKDKSRRPIVKEIPTTEVADHFWISVRGPLKAQAHALQRLRELMADLQGVVVELGTVQVPDLETYGG